MSNMFAMLEEEDDVVEIKTRDLTRKAKKKMREIETLKAKSCTTDEEKRKIQEETIWKPLTPSNNVLEVYNHFDISNSFRKCCVKEGDDCPICLNPICKNMGVVTDCGHSYCRVCISNLITNSKQINCSLCRNNITNLDFQNEDYMFEIMETLSKKKEYILEYIFTSSIYYGTEPSIVYHASRSLTTGRIIWRPDYTL